MLSNSFTGGYPCANCGGWIQPNSSWPHQCPRREPLVPAPVIINYPQLADADIDRIAEQVAKRVEELLRKD